MVASSSKSYVMFHGVFVAYFHQQRVRFWLCIDYTSIYFPDLSPQEFSGIWAVLKHRAKIAIKSKVENLIRRSFVADFTRRVYPYFTDNEMKATISGIRLDNKRLLARRCRASGVTSLMLLHVHTI